MSNTNGEQAVICPETGRQIFLEPAVLRPDNGNQFICPACGRLHELQGKGRRVVDLGPNPGE